MEVSTFIWVAIVSLIALALLGGLAPLKARRWDRSGRFLSMGNMFSAGIFLGGGLLHLLPEAMEQLEEVTKESGSEMLEHFPHGPFLCGIGFMCILLVEELVLACTSGSGREDEDHSAGDIEASPLKPQGIKRIASDPTLNREDRFGKKDRKTSTPPRTIQHKRSDSMSSHNLSSSPSPSMSLASSPGQNDQQNMRFLKLYFQSRNAAHNVARGLVVGLAPRTSLVDTQPVPSSPSPAQRARRRRKHHASEAPRVQSSRAQVQFSSPHIQRPLLTSEHDSAASHDHHSSDEDDHEHHDEPPPRVERKLMLNDIETGHGNHDHDHDHSDHADGDNHRHSHSSSSKSPGHSHGSQSHGHSHGADGHGHMDMVGASSSIVAYILVLALSFHSVFEGIALGVQDDMTAAVSIFIAIAAHTPLAGFALGTSLVNARARTRMIIICICLFSITVPIGAVLGLALSYGLEGDVLKAVSAGFQSFSSGTFLFVAFGEIIPKEMANPRDKGWKLLLLLIGFLGMAAIKLNENHDHGGHDHDHDHDPH